ncbi:MAG: aldehyde dehydrogenase [Herbiconiux sp.]|uniref:aldehyde dehydrogenase family protein n=1 Tax=Herbiconiux sp. TaxID=1871186 RepID=UPI00122435C9|nr:aldehyde dehydrogenase family protein [Herbiconiux sp.]TAJ46934.1 MAG: aldehyde dehydrogenase [Herbiconiux sp.]
MIPNDAPSNPWERTSLPNGRHLIGGEWVPARTGEVVDVIDPSSGTVITTVPRGDATDVDDAARAAEEAFPAWRDESATVRGELVHRWAELCRERASDLDALEAFEVGRPLLGSSPIPRTIAYVAGAADKVAGLTLPSHHPDALGMTLREPYGVCGSIIPWNVPGKLMAADVAPAVAAGNTIVVKPAEDAPLTVLYLAALAQQAGLPAGVLNVVTGYGAEAGAALPENARIRRMSFTGSPDTGRRVMEACSRRLIPVHLELGGKSPQVVLGDADLSRAVPAIVTSMTFNAGQVCAAGTRVVVDRSRHAELVDRVAERVANLRMGSWDSGADMGPLINARQQDRVLGYLDVGRGEGADVVVGGSRPSGAEFDSGFYVQPTIFDSVTPEMRIAQEEIFGPVLAVLPVDGAEEAVSVANGTEYGLVASVWTHDVGTAVRTARRVQAGQVYVNTMGSTDVIGAPFGGYKRSGFGRTMAADTILDYTQVKTLIIKAE